jgi:hypothetical protein
LIPWRHHTFYLKILHPHNNDVHSKIRVAMSQGARFFLYIVSLVMLPVFGDPSPSFALEVEMPTCAMIQYEMDKGSSLKQGILSIITANQKQEKTLLNATMKTMLRDAIKECHLEPNLVLQAGYQGGVPIAIIFTAADEAGVSPETVEKAFGQAGADPSQIRKEKPESLRSVKPPISILRDKRAPIGSGVR